MASRRRNDSSHGVWPSSANASVFSFTSLSTSGSFFFLNCTSVSAGRAKIAPTFAIEFCIDEARRSCFLVLLSSLSQISVLTRGTIRLSQFPDRLYFFIFSFIFGSLSLADRRLLIMSGKLLINIQTNVFSRLDQILRDFGQQSVMLVSSIQDAIFTLCGRIDPGSVVLRSVSPSLRSLQHPFRVPYSFCVVSLPVPLLQTGRSALFM